MTTSPYPYAVAAQKRHEAGYEGQECPECPGQVSCVRAYDLRCGKYVIAGDVFPCGLRPRDDVDLRTMTVRVRKKAQRPRVPCPECGKPMGRDSARCLACENRRRREDRAVREMYARAGRKAIEGTR